MSTILRMNSDRFYKLAFLVVFWVTWYGLPFINGRGNENMERFLLAMLPVSAIYIPLFFINSELLIKRVFRRSGLGGYLLSLIALLGAFTLIHLFLKQWLLPAEFLRHHWDVFWSFVPVFFVTAISTGYGFITYLLDQEKVRRDEQRERLQSEVSFLRSQISPHFIFNILNSIVYLIRSKSAQAEAVTIKLSELMRYMLYQSQDKQVPLDKELDYLRNYVELQKMRFEEDVDIRLNIEGDGTAQSIEPMLMIPFVENAFKHGVGMVKDPIIDISLVYNADQLDFNVKNKIAPEGAEDKDSSSGIGLKNVKRRLELLYPNEHQLNFEDADGWFTARLGLRLGHGGKR
ncbi:MAG: histidine kinase [Lewinellaceae bacterium]|nr:histidine kinase [Lewinella sp.]MCB9280446.1 histidine kinase [Lewinellaceae bacterium]